jgi:phosphate transport system substrate-binding protein
MRLTQILITAALAGLSGACGTAGPTDAAGPLQINGAGATFPYPIYSKWFAEYDAHQSEVRINYQSIGSGGGIRQLSSHTVFFGATDSPMTDEQLSAAGGPVLHFPTVLGAVVPIYNVPGVDETLRFSGALLAQIILGQVTTWNDPAVVALNPGVALPETDITVVHRSDGSGTTFIFLDFLSKVSPTFASTVGVGTSVNWPVGVGGKGNEGVAGLVKLTPGAIGYVELIYALQSVIPHGAVQNAEGAFIVASVESVTAAAAGAVADIPDDFRVSITNAPGSTSYPISSFTWLLLYENPEDSARGQAMVAFLSWALTDGQRFATALGYAPLPPDVVAREQAVLRSLTAP